ncbi:Esterase lipase thioesterase active site [Coemansia spiralis]|uniref:Esterase lipase thioesterase active site n=2 Tax=Coemansia TaxID=4863 RepID=A0A9W8KYJ9_9FUNG|nr:Alpha/Beta hydrolase protein [Coemansia spiralis]KAJ1989992.1 Esterase lipase thioesterase active site [Coemansia umbellata]KAJ2621507.1 Esterase lipase thioesterase active site [Coemansia sp. RSA 1358]KAJ2677183.1 Esterase lipase thioesterase active site [Coemansia spiralis]
MSSDAKPSPAVAPYGSWRSPFTASAIASSASAISLVLVDKARPTTMYWLESRPSEGGRYTLLTQSIVNGSARELTSSQWNVRTAVHEYGGGAYAVHDGLVVFSNWSDQGVYLLDTTGDSEPVRIGTCDNKMRYAAFTIHPSKRFVVCVREDHRESDIEAPAALVAIPLPQTADESGPTEDIVLFNASDFVSSPVLSTRDNEIAFFAWNHPDMNWDATTLYRAQLDIISSAAQLPKAGLRSLKIVAGGANDPRESVYQPRFDNDGMLHFISDRDTGFWNPYHVDAKGCVVASLAEPIYAEFAEPEWQFGESTFQPIPGRGPSMVVTYRLNGVSHLGILNTTTHVLEELPVPGWTALGNFQMGASRSGEPVLVLSAGGPAEKTAIYAYFLNGIATKVCGVEASQIDTGYVSVPREIVFETRLPAANGEKEAAANAYAFYYAPTNRDFRGPEGELPPLLVLSHGGPTGAADTAFKPRVQYWTSRGFAVVDVNYGGSTGYGRAYRERLYPQFGVVDVRDCCAAALHLADAGLVDRRRLSIMGGSAGGFTTLACLAFRPEVFAVGASHYGISDLEVLAKETHKFEAQYPVHLVGPYPSERKVYVERSPLHAVGALACPVVFFQGLEDKVVPPNQATLMAQALREKGIRVAHVEFAGEQHGFRKYENIVRALEAQLFFFGRILGFQPADDIEPVVIDNE